MVQCIVVFDDDNGLCVPMGPDPSCEGAIESNGKEISLFSDRKAAKRAITISVKNAELLQAQGKTANDDFLSARKHIKIRPVVAAK